MEFQPRQRQRQRPFASLHNQKEDNNQPEINKQPKAPESQTAQNSDNKGIKEKTSRRTTTLVRWWTNSEKPPQHRGPPGRAGCRASQAVWEGLA